MPVFLGIALKWILGRLQGLVRVILANPLPCLVIALCALSAALWHRGDRYRDRLEAANAIIQAGEDNVKALEADKARVESQQAQVTQRTDHDTPTKRSDALAASDAYSRAHQCVRPSAPAVAASDQGGGRVPEVPVSTGSAEASGEAAALVAVPKWGVDNCSLNTADFQQAIDWASGVSAAQP